MTLLVFQGTAERVPSASISGVVVRLGTNETMAGSYVELRKDEVLCRPNPTFCWKPGRSTPPFSA